MAAKKYKTKPTFVEAEQWFPRRKVPGVVHEDIAIGNMYYHAWILHVHGRIGVNAGDWIVREGNNIQIMEDRLFRSYYVTLDDEPIPQDITKVETDVIRRTHDKRPT